MAAAIKYCNKEDTAIEGTRFTYGVEPKSGGDKKSFTYLNSLNKTEIGELTPYAIVQLDKAKKIMRLLECEPYHANDCRGIWLHGAPGVGKSRRAFEDYPGAFRKSQNKWWDGYVD
jgi:hypothetical protein